MEDQIGSLRAAGFNDDEIASWTAQKRAELSAAGFGDHEIDAYLVGGVTVKPEVPAAMLERFSGADDMTALQKLRRMIGGGVTDRIGAAMFEGAAAGFGESPIGLSAEDTKKLQDLGVFRKPGAPLNVASGLQFANEALIRPLYGAIESVFRGVNAVVSGAGAAGGQAVAEASGANEAEAARARRDGAAMATVAALLAGAGQPMARSVRTPTGEIVTETIGGVPRSSDFVDAARATKGDAALPTQQKFLDLYEQRGLHPAEVAQDAASDPVVKQRLLSSERGDLPDYGGKPPEELPPKPPKPPEPPEPGSFEEAQRKVLDKVSVGERESRPLSWRKLYTEAIDDLHPIKGVSEDAYQLARLTRGQFGKAEHFLEQGTFDFDTLHTTGKPLREVLEPVRDDLYGLRAYLTSKRALEIEATERASGIDIDAARRVVEEGRGKYDAVAGELVDYQNRVLDYLRKSGVLSEGAYDAMVAANKAYVPFYRVFGAEEGGPGAGRSFGPGNPVKRLKGSERGFVDPLESIIKNTYAYVSIAERNAVGVEIIGALEREGLKARTGAAKPSGVEAELIDYLKQNGVPEAEKLVEFVKASAADDGTSISAFREGKRVSVEVNDPELVAAFRGLDQQSAGMLTKIFAVPARALRAGAVLTPDFMARNLLRDFMTAFVNSKGLFSPIDSIKGLKSAITKDDAYSAWVKSGGANATMVALDRRYMQESLTRLTDETGLGTRAWNVVTNPLAGLRLTSELIENATRIGEFRKALGDGASKAEMQAAAYASREVTLDFARIGAKMRAYNMITAFGNAQIQGLDRIGRAFADRPLNSTLKVAGGITLPSVLLWAANHDDPRYQELPDWQKDLFWIIPTDKWEPISATDAANKPAHLLRQVDGQWQVNNGHIFRIPKPFELGVVFGSGVERALDAAIGKDPEAFQGFAKSVASVVTPNVLPTAAQPVFEQWANRSTFTDRTLIPADVEKQLPEYQYTPYTTELSKALGKLVASFPGLREASVDPGNIAGPGARAATSPVLIENYIRSWTGGLGFYALQFADVGARKAGVVPDPITPTPTLADIPFVKAFAVRYPSASTESIQRFYDDYERDKRYFDTWMAKAREGDVAAMERIQAAGGPTMFVRLDAIKDTLSQHSKLIRDVYKNPQIPAAEKRQLIDGLYYSMIEIGRAGRDTLRQSKAALDDKP